MEKTAKLGVLKREGFIINCAIKLSNGLSLQTTGNLMYLGKEQRRKTLGDFCEAINFLIQDGWKVENITEFNEELAEYWKTNNLKIKQKYQQ